MEREAARYILFFWKVVLFCTAAVFSTSSCSYDYLHFVKFPAYDCIKCRYIVQAIDNVVDGAALNILPGDFICLSSEIRRNKPILFVNINGTEGNPIVITNCGGSVSNEVLESADFNLKFEKSQHFRVTSLRDGDDYGLKLFGATLGLSLDRLSTNFEVDNIEVGNVSFAGIMAKTDPSCDSASIRGNFVMRGVSLHDNYVHDAGGEGFYVGNSFYTSGVNLPCGIRFPHEVNDVNIYNNHVTNTGRESVQLGCAVKGAMIYSNYCENFGLSGIAGQTNGIQVGEGTGGICFNNFITTGIGNGIIVLGLGDNIVFNNVIVQAGGCGIFCDNRYTPGPGFNFVNNTIISPHDDGIRIYADSSYLLNKVVNNFIVNPGTYSQYASGKFPDRTGNDAFLFLRDTSVHVQQMNNLFSLHVSDTDFIDPLQNNFSLAKQSQAVDAGADISTFGIIYDFCGRRRPDGKKIDIGAFEYHTDVNSNGIHPCGIARHPRNH